MKAIEYFMKRLDGWLTISLDNYFSILFSQEDKKFSKLRIPKGLPIRMQDQNSQPKEELILSAGNFIEVLIKRNLILEKSNKKGQIQIANSNSNNQSEEKIYEVWTRGKIINNDTNLKILFVEVNGEIKIIDKMEEIRPLKEIKSTQNISIVYNIKHISSNEYNLIKNEFDKLLATNPNNNKLFYIKYDVINSSLLCFGNKDDLNDLLLLKQQEQRYNEEQNSISDMSNPNSTNNLIGVGIKSPGGSDNSDTKAIILDDDVKNEINEYKYKCCFSYRDKFKKDLEKDFGDLFQKCKYYVGKNNDNNFDIILYGNNEEDFHEEKSNFEKEYKQVKYESDINIDKNEVKELAKKSNIKYIDIEKKSIYLIGEEKNIKNFKVVWDMSKDYSKDIQKVSKEKESIQKELQTYKKKHKIK